MWLLFSLFAYIYEFTQSIQSYSETGQISIKPKIETYSFLALTDSEIVGWL